MINKIKTNDLREKNQVLKSLPFHPHSWCTIVECSIGTYETREKKDRETALKWVWGKQPQQSLKREKRLATERKGTDCESEKRIVKPLELRTLSGPWDRQDSCRSFSPHLPLSLSHTISLTSSFSFSYFSLSRIQNRESRTRTCSLPTREHRAQSSVFILLRAPRFFFSSLDIALCVTSSSNKRPRLFNRTLFPVDSTRDHRFKCHCEQNA